MAMTVTLVHDFYVLVRRVGRGIIDPLGLKLLVTHLQRKCIHFYLFFHLAGNPTQFKMKIQLSFALFFCLLHFSFAEESDDFCDNGPPGKYCLQDLSGYHDCHVDPSTGKMVDKIYSCPDNTR